MAFLFKVLLLLTAVFMIILILVQRGKGGGLAGAFGGLGGQSAFGTKAGDTFTRITIGVAAFWIVLCLLSVRMLTATKKGALQFGSGNPAAQQQEGVPGQGSGAGGTSGGSDDGEPYAP